MISFPSCAPHTRLLPRRCCLDLRARAAARPVSSIGSHITVSRHGKRMEASQRAVMAAADGSKPVVPAILSVLPNLEWLDVSYNEAHVLTPDLGYCPRLRYLDASHNAITRIEDALCSSVTLVHLDVSFNKLTHFSAVAGLRMQALEVLDVSCNQLERLPDTLGQCFSLRHLRAAGNLLVNMPSSLGHIMHALTSFDVDNNPLVRGSLGAHSLHRVAACATRASSCCRTLACSARRWFLRWRWHHRP
ncbi:leucine-rich repeat domain-containing protein [archaeon]|nr:MAG: leucine-rich repeat domain-containing protein [archaeon]